MGKIIYLMGKSSSGKDTIFKRLLEDDTIELQTVVPYTTRPIRDGEKNGVEYFFTDEAGFRCLQEQGKIIEAREYHTFHGLWRYFTVDDGQIKSDGNYIMIGTPEAYLRMRKLYGKERMLPIMIELDDGVRLQRALDRERKQEMPKYEEMCRRFLADSVDFSREKLESAEIGTCFINDNLEACLDKIKSYIKSNI